MWVCNAVGSAIVTKLSASDGKVLGTFSVNSVGYAVIFDGTHVWVANSLGTVTRLKTDGTNAGVFGLGAAGEPFGLAFDGANIWVADDQAQGMLVKLRASDGAVLGSFLVGGTGPYGIAFDGVHIWVANGNNLVQVRVSDGSVLHTFPTPGTSAGVAFDGANLWIAEYDGKTISKM